MKEKMTLFYSKRTGEIKAYTSGETDMNFFGEDKKDFELILDHVVVELDDYVMSNTERFEVVEGAVKYIQPDIPERYL